MGRKSKQTVLRPEFYKNWALVIVVELSRAEGNRVGSPTVDYIFLFCSILTPQRAIITTFFIRILSVISLDRVSWSSFVFPVVSSFFFPKSTIQQFCFRGVFPGSVDCFSYKY